MSWFDWFVDAETRARLRTLEQSLVSAHFKLDNIEFQEKKIMATLEQFQAGFEKVGAETTRIGEGVLEILRRLRAGGLSAEQEQEQFDKLEAHAARLAGISVDPDNPVPPVATSQARRR